MTRMPSHFVGFLLGSLSVACVFLLVGAIPSASRTVEASRFLLRSDDGRTRGAFEILADGRSAFDLRDKEGQKRIVHSVGTDGGSRFELLDEHGRTRASLTLERNDEAPIAPVLTLYDGLGRSRVSMTVSSAGDPSLVFQDGDGINVVQLATLLDHQTLTLGKTTAGSLVLHNDGSLSAIRLRQPGKKTVIVKNDTAGAADFAIHGAQGALISIRSDANNKQSVDTR